MRKRLVCLAVLLFAVHTLVFPTTAAHADRARSVGYVLSFRLGVEASRAQELVDELAKATGDWHGQKPLAGTPVAKSCASSRECVRNAAAALDVSRIGIVAIVAAGGVVRIDVRLMDANTGSEIQRTHAEYERGADASKAQRAIFDLIPRLLPGEKAAVVAATPPEPPVEDKPLAVPPVTDIPEEPVTNTLDLNASPAPKASGTRWWLWGGLGAAATAAIITSAILMTRDDSPSGPVLELPPPQ